MMSYHASVNIVWIVWNSIIAYDNMTDPQTRLVEEQNNKLWEELFLSVSF